MKKKIMNAWFMSKNSFDCFVVMRTCFSCRGWFEESVLSVFLVTTKLQLLTSKGNSLFSNNPFFLFIIMVTLFSCDNYLALEAQCVTVLHIYQNCILLYIKPKSSWHTWLVYWTELRMKGNVLGRSKFSYSEAKFFLIHASIFFFIFKKTFGICSSYTSGYSFQ